MDVLHPLLLGDVPAAADRPEGVVLVAGVESEEVGLVPADAARQVVAVEVVIAHVGVEGGIAVERLALAVDGAAGEALRAVVDQALPALVGQRQPVHPDGGQGLLVVSVHHLVDDPPAAVLTQFQTHNGIDVMLRFQETPVEVELVAERIAVGVVRLLFVAAALGQQALAVLVDEGIVGHAHLVGVRVVVTLAAVLRPLVLEHHVVAEQLQELGLQVDEGPHTGGLALGQSLVERLQHVEAIRLQTRGVGHLADP